MGLFKSWQNRCLLVIFVTVVECVHMHNHSESQYDRLLPRFLRLL